MVSKKQKSDIPTNTFKLCRQRTYVETARVTYTTTVYRLMISVPLNVYRYSSHVSAYTKKYDAIEVKYISTYTQRHLLANLIRIAS